MIEIKGTGAERCNSYAALIGLEEIASDVQAHMDFCRSTLKLCLVVIHHAALQLMRSATTLAIALGFASCTLGPPEYRIQTPPATFARPLVDSIALKVAYSYGPDVDKEVPFSESGPGPGARYHIYLSAATRSSFDMVLPAMFTEATSGSPRPGQAGAIRVDVVGARVSQRLGEERASVTYSLTFLDPDGSLQATWFVTGFSALPKSAEENLALSVREAAAHVAHDMGQQPAIRAWLAEARDGPEPEGTH